MNTQSRTLCIAFLVLTVLIVAPSRSGIALGSRPSVDETSKTFLPLVMVPDPWAQVDPSGQNIVFWHVHSGSREMALLNIVNEFNTANPWGITVVAENLGSYNNIEDEMSAVLNTPAAPDLVVAYQEAMATYQLSEGLLDMRTLVDSSTWGLSQADKTDFFPGSFNRDVFPTLGNARLGFPPQSAMEVLYYNTEWLLELGYSSPPTTTAQFHEMACNAVANPFSERIGEESTGYMFSQSADTFTSWTLALGGDIFDSQGGQYTLNSQAAVDAMTFLQDLFNNGCSTLVSSAYPWTEFGAGRLLFSAGSSTALAYYKAYVNLGAQFDWNVGAFPHTTVDPVMNTYGAGISIPQHTPERELAAWLFLKFFTSADVQDDWVRATNYFPVRQTTAANLTGYFNSNPRYASAFNLLPYGKSGPSVPHYMIVRDLISAAMAEILQGADVTTTLDQLNVDANSTLQW